MVPPPILPSFLPSFLPYHPPPHAAFALKMVPPAAYANCPDEYRGLADHKYLSCEIGPDQDRCALLRELHRAKDFRHFFLALLPLAIAILALVPNFLLAPLSLRLILRPSGGGKKRLALLLSRSIACLLVLFLLLAVLLAWRFGALAYWSVVIFLCVGVAQFLAMAGTNLALSSLLYTALLHPLLYRSRFSMGSCWALIGSIWAIAIGASIPFGLLGATLFYPQSAPLHCPFAQCQWPLSLCLFLLLSLAYSFTILSHLAMLFQMRRRIKSRIHPRSHQSKGSAESASLERHFRAMRRLSLNLLVFSLSKVPFVFISLVALINLENLSQLGLGQKTSCKTYLHGHLFFFVEFLSSLALTVWLIGMALDPAIDLFLDPRFRQFFQYFFSHIKSLFLVVPQRSLVE